MRTDFAQKIHYIEEHLHSIQMVRPHLAMPITVTADAASWTYGALSNDIIAVSDIAYEFDIHWIDVLANNDDYYQLALIAGDSTLIAEVSFRRVSIFTRSIQAPIICNILPAGTRIRAQLASNAGSSSCEVKVLLHPYI